MILTQFHLVKIKVAGREIVKFVSVPIHIYEETSEILYTSTAYDLRVCHGHLGKSKVIERKRLYVCLLNIVLMGKKYWTLLFHI